MATWLIVLITAVVTAIVALVVYVVLGLSGIVPIYTLGEAIGEDECDAPQPPSDEDETG